MHSRLLILWHIHIILTARAAVIRSLSRVITGVVACGRLSFAATILYPMMTKKASIIPPAISPAIKIWELQVCMTRAAAKTTERKKPQKQKHTQLFCSSNCSSNGLYASRPRRRVNLPSTQNDESRRWILHYRKHESIFKTILN